MSPADLHVVENTFKRGFDSFRAHQPFNNLWLVTSLPLNDCDCFCGCGKSQVLLLIAAVDHILDLSRSRVQINHGCNQAAILRTNTFSISS